MPISYAGPEDPALKECREARWAYEEALRWDLAADGHYPTPLSDMCSAFARLYGRRKLIHYFFSTVIPAAPHVVASDYTMFL